LPHPTTLVKLTRRVGPAVVEQLNQALLAKAANHEVLPTHKVRLDTTVVAANVRDPTDAGLLAKAVSTLANTIGRVQATGGATPTTTRDRRRAARRRAHQLARSLRARSEQAKRQVTGRTAELAGLAEQAAADAARVARNARRQLAHAGSSAPGKLARLVSELETTIGRTQQVLGQARTRLAGQTPDGASRLVSLHDPDARPIVKGRLGKPVEFGDKAQVADNADGVVLDYLVEVGNPAEAPLLVPAVERIMQQTGRVPGRRPPTAATARPPSRTSCTRWAWSRWRSLAGARPAGPAEPTSTTAASGGWSSGAPAVRADQPPQARLRLGPNPDGRHRRRQDLVRAGGVRPQPGQGRWASRSQAAAAGRLRMSQTRHWARRATRRP
jgi:hypothetical protein